MISITPAIKSLKIRNLGIVKKADMKFTKGINIVYGVCGGGKTTVINAIKHVLNGEKLIYGPSHDKNRSEKAVIEVELLGKKIRVEVKGQVSCYEQCLRKGILPDLRKLPHSIKSVEDMKNRLSTGEKAFLEIIEAIRTSNKGQAILIDDAWSLLDIKHKELMLKLFRKSKLQIIMVARREDELVKGANVIRLRLPRWTR